MGIQVEGTSGCGTGAPKDRFVDVGVIPMGIDVKALQEKEWFAILWDGRVGCASLAMCLVPRFGRRCAQGQVTSCDGSEQRSVVSWPLPVVYAHTECGEETSR